MHAVLGNFRPRAVVGRADPGDACDPLHCLTHAKESRVHSSWRAHSEGENWESGGYRSSRCSAPPADWRTSSQPKNNDSLVLRVSFHESSVLLEGDAEKPVEQRMTRRRNGKPICSKSAITAVRTVRVRKYITTQSAALGHYLGGCNQHVRSSAAQTLEHLQQEGVYLPHRSEWRGDVLSRREVGQPTVGVSSSRSISEVSSASGDWRYSSIMRRA